jgi:hypothetical protein
MMAQYRISFSLEMKEVGGSMEGPGWGDVVGYLNDTSPTALVSCDGWDLIVSSELREEDFIEAVEQGAVDLNFPMATVELVR